MIFIYWLRNVLQLIAAQAVKHSADGSHALGVGGDGPITRCPDGTYVAGRCTLAPNGKYVGVN
jgi:hypothetical protein